MATLPLEGIRVLDLSRLLPGPYCSMLLADYGAEVLKIEDPGIGDYLRAIPPMVDGTSAYFRALNRNKQSLTLNLKAPEGVEILLKLAETADVVLESFRPGVADRLGVGYEALKARNPRLVYCSITGYGQTGPLRDRSGHDLDYMALAGALAQLAPGPDALPVLPGVQVADMAGAMYGALSILMALLGRERTGEGRYLDVAMLDGAMSWLPFTAARTFARGKSPAPGQTELTGALARYANYRTRDDRAIALGTLEDKFWKAFCQAAGHPEWLEERSEAVLRETLTAYFASEPLEHWVRWAADKDVCLEPVLTFAEALEHPQVRARGLVSGSDKPEALLAPIPLEGARPPIRTASPGLGDQTAEVLAGLGLSDDQISSLRDRGVV